MIPDVFCQLLPHEESLDRCEEDWKIVKCVHKCMRACERASLSSSTRRLMIVIVTATPNKAVRANVRAPADLLSWAAKPRVYVSLRADGFYRFQRVCLLQFVRGCEYACFSSCVDVVVSVSRHVDAWIQAKKKGVPGHAPQKEGCLCPGTWTESICGGKRFHK